jgi:hypothetical protein
LITIFWPNPMSYEPSTWLGKHLCSSNPASACDLTWAHCSKRQMSRILVPWLSAWSKIVECKASEMVLLNTSWGICHQNVRGGGEVSELLPNKKRETRGPMPPWGSTMKGRRTVLLLFKAAIICLPWRNQCSLLMLWP